MVIFRVCPEEREIMKHFNEVVSYNLVEFIDKSEFKYVFKDVWIYLTSKLAFIGLIICVFLLSYLEPNKADRMEYKKALSWENICI